MPAKPAPIDPGLRASTDRALAADRADATFEAQQDPLTGAPARAANGLFAAAKPLPAPSQDAAGAALDATAAPPPPVKAAAPAVSAVDVPIPDIAADAAPLPPIPDAPPAPPHLAGVRIPVTAPRLPPKAPPPPPGRAAALSAAETAPVSIGFRAGSAVLSADGQSALQTLAHRRGSHGVEVVGFGESDGQDAQSQYAGVQLGLARARAVAAALEGDGVPIGSLHLAAIAPGRGGAARLVD